MLSKGQRLALDVLEKRTYRATGALKRTDVPIGLGPTTRPLGDEHELVTDLELTSERPGVCVSVVGHAHGRGASRAALVVCAGPARKVVEVIGPRVAERWNGRWRFSPPAAFERVPISYRHAYGGVDPGVDLLPERSLEAFFRLALQAKLGFHPGAYPRNPVGAGFVCTAGRPGEVELPRFEAPDDPLTPERLECDTFSQWWTMPRPALTLPSMPGWFPRSVDFGCVPEQLQVDDSRLAEVRTGTLAAGFLSEVASRAPEARVAPRAFAGGPEGLSALDLTEGARVEVEGVPSRIAFEMPHRESWPLLSASTLGRSLDARPMRPLWVSIDGDEGIVAVTFGARVELGDGYVTRRSYERLTDFDPFADVRLTIDGERVDPPRPSWKEAS